MPGSRTVDRALRESASKAGENEPVYVTEHEVGSDFDFPKDFSIDTWPGLIFCQILVNKDEKRQVVAWWKSRETWEAWTKQFIGALGITSAPCFQGFQRTHLVTGDLRRRRLSPAAIATAVGALVALLTGLSTIQDFAYTLLAIPDCTLWTDSAVTNKPHAIGDTFDVTVQVKNRHLRVKGTAMLKPVLSGGAENGLTLVDPVAYPVLVDPGKSEIQEFHFVAVKSGKYKIQFQGTQTAGWALSFWPRQIPEIPPVTIDVWDPIDKAPTKFVVRSDDRSATVKVEVHNAEPMPYGTAFEATLTNPDDVELRPDVSTIKEAESPLKIADYAVLQWRAPPSTDALTVQTTRLLLQGSAEKARTATDWSSLLSHLSVTVDEP